MIRRHVIGTMSVLTLFATSACVDDPEGTGKERADSAVERADGGSDAGEAQTDAEVEADAATEVDGGSSTDAGSMDAAMDAGAEMDADAEDASSDDASVEHDADLPDASIPDASMDDASMDDGSLSDGGEPDAGPPPLAAHYDFNENTGDSAQDLTGNFGGASLLNAAGWTTGVSGSALQLSGSMDQYVTLPVDILDSCTDVTVALWMKLGAVTNWSRLLDIDGGSNGFLFFTPAQDVGGAPHLYFNMFYVPSGQPGSDQGVSAAYPDGVTLENEWHHVAFTLSAGTGRLYFDGQEIGSAAMNATPSDLDIGANAHAWIGRSMFPDPYLNAAIDDLRVSCTAYSAEQVAALAE